MFIVEIKLPESTKTFRYKWKDQLKSGDQVVIDSAGVVSLAKVVDSFKCCRNDHKEILRLATKKDVNSYESLVKLSDAYKKTIIDIAKPMHPEMNIKQIVIGLNKKGLKVIYTSPNMIMFNDLVKKISHKYKMKVFMQQLNPREQASTTDTYGVCGQKLCCSGMLKKIPSVKVSTIRKQDITINPVNNNGCCGKLKCCFNYEADTYKEWKEENPKKNSIVKYKGEEYKLVGINYFIKEAILKDKKGAQTKVKVSELEELKN